MERNRNSRSNEMTRSRTGNLCYRAQVYRKHFRIGERGKIFYIKTGLVLFTILFVFTISTVSYHSVKTYANGRFKYYTCITVQYGETLWSIADRYIDYDYYRDKEDYIAEVESINHLEKEELLLSGQRLVVPYYSAEYIP